MSDEKNTQPENQSENELSENELNQIAGGGAEPHLTQPGTQNILIGLLLPAVKVSTGDVNGDNFVQGNLLGK